MRTIKAVLEGHRLNQKALKQSSCLLAIRPGQDLYEGEKLAVTFDLMNRTFGSVILVLEDSLQRHTMALMEEHKQACCCHELAIQAGDQWLERNLKICQKLKNLQEIVRWETFLKQSEYPLLKQVVLHLLRTEADYQASFEQAIDAFLTQYYPHLLDKPNFDKQRARKLYLDYLIEESAVFCLWTTFGYQFELFPGQKDLVKAKTYEHFLQPFYPDLLHPIAMKFIGNRRCKNLKTELN